MKHTLNRTLKKLTAAAMAFTLLGAGTAITKSVAPKADNTLKASAAVYGQRYTVVLKSGYLNVRSGPSTNCEIKGKLYNGTTVYVYGFYNGWACLSTQNDAWVKASYLM